MTPASTSDSRKRRMPAELSLAERIAQAIESKSCGCRDSYCSVRNAIASDARIARSFDDEARA